MSSVDLPFCRGLVRTSPPLHKDIPARLRTTHQTRVRADVTHGYKLLEVSWLMASHGSPKMNDMPRNAHISSCEFGAGQHKNGSADHRITWKRIGQHVNISQKSDFLDHSLYQREACWWTRTGCGLSMSSWRPVQDLSCMPMAQSTRNFDLHSAQRHRAAH